MKYGIKKACIVGAGVMGAGIAAWIAGTGIPVVMLDIVPKDLNDYELKKGITKDDPAHLNRLAQAGKDRVSDKKNGVLLTPRMADYIMVGNLDTSLDMIRDCDWIVEVVAENLKIKQSMFQKITPYIKKDAIISTNTSGIPISKISEKMPPDLQQRFLGTHFFNPPRYMHLLEVIPTEKTDSEVVDYMKKFCRNILGKGVITAHDTPNFIGNRIGSLGVPCTWELMKKYNFDIETVDYLTGKLIGHPKSASFRTADMVGIDVLTHVNDNLVELLDDPDEKSSFVLPDVIRKMVKNGQLGNKTGGGFYKKTRDKNGKKSYLVWDPEKNAYIPSQKVKIPFIEEAKKIHRLKDRLNHLLYSNEPEGKFLWELTSQTLLYSSWKMPEIADSYEDIDNAMKWGYNWEVGPFETWDLIGFEKSAKRMKEEGKKLPDWVEKRLSEREPFYKKDPDIHSFDTVYPVIKSFVHTTLLDMGDGVAGLEFHSPGNCVTAHMRKEIISAIDEIENNNDYVGMVLLNSEANFLTGSDLKEMVEGLLAQQFDKTEGSVAEFQNVSMRLKYAKKPIVAAIHGMTIGGGCEFSMHSSRIVAHVDTYMGFVEPGVGLIPSGGGLKELAQRASAYASTYGYTDLLPIISKYLTQVATAQVSKNAYQALDFGYLQPTDIIIMQIDDLAQRAKEEVLQMAKDGYRQKTAQLIKVTGRSGFANAEISLKTMQHTGYISETDCNIGLKVARALTGGDVPKGTLLTEGELLGLEREGFCELTKEPKTQERIFGMVKTHHAIRN